MAAVAALRNAVAGCGAIPSQVGPRDRRDEDQAVLDRLRRAGDAVCVLLPDAQRTAPWSRAVAEAADAWLNDPRDTGAYERLVGAVERWREHVRPPLPGTETITFRDTLLAGPESDREHRQGPEQTAEVAAQDSDAGAGSGSADAGRGGAAAGGAQIGEALGSPPGPSRPVASLGDLLAGDPATVLRRLRGARPSI